MSEEIKNTENQESTEIETTEKTEKSEKSKKPQNQSSKKPLSRKKKKMLFSAAISLCVIVAVVIVNMLAIQLTARYPSLSLDTTSLKSFELSAESKTVAEKLDKKVTITFLKDKNTYEAYDTYCKQTSLLVSKLAEASDGLITVKYTDLVQNPTIQNDYQGETLSETDMIIQCGDKYKILTRNDLFNFEQYSENYTYIASSKAEQAISNALVTVTSDVSTKVALITDNNSNSTADYQYLERNLTANNYDVIEMSLEKDTLTADIQTVIIYAPEKDFTSDAVEKLNAYLSNSKKYGKNLLYIPYEQHADTPNLDAFLETCGMSLGDGIAYETDTSALMMSSYFEGIAASYASDLYKDNLDNSKYPVTVGYTKPITVLSDDVTPLLQLSAVSGFMPFSADTANFSLSDGITGEKTCVMAQYQTGDDKAKSTVVVAGSKKMFTGTYLASGYTNSNSTYVLNMFAELNGRDNSMITVAEKVITNYDISLSQSTAFFLGALMFVIVPLIILGIGFVVYLARRNK